MTALIVSDLHYRWPWYEWILSPASAVDAVLIAADFLDLFCSDPPLSMQGSRVRSWIVRLAREKRVAYCSGNRDGPYVDVSAADGLTAPASRNLVANGATSVVGDYVITCVPYWVDGGVKEKLMSRGRAYRTGKRLFLIFVRVLF